MQQLYTRAEFARIAGVTKQAVWVSSRTGKLVAAVDGERIDANHPAAQEYLAAHGMKAPDPLAKPKPEAKSRSARGRRGRPKRLDSAARAQTKPAKPAESEPGAPPAVSPTPPAKEPVRLVAREVTDISQVADMTIRDVVAKFGTVTAFKDWLSALRTIEDVRERNLRNAEADGNVISIRLVRSHVFGVIEQAFRRLLTDSAKTITRRVYGASRSEVAIEDAETIVREVISSQLKPIKDAAVKMLRERPEV